MRKVDFQDDRPEPPWTDRSIDDNPQEQQQQQQQRRKRRQQSQQLQWEDDVQASGSVRRSQQSHQSLLRQFPDEDGSPNSKARGREKREAKPLDISRGKALFKKYQHVLYNSVTHRNWVATEVILVREDGCILVDVKDDYWFSIDEQRIKFKETGWQAWAEGTELQYFSVTQGGWRDCNVAEVRQEDQAVRISIKPDYWMEAHEQEEKLRLPCVDKWDELLYKAGRLLEGDEPDVERAEQRYREVLRGESDHVPAMEGLAVLLRDFKEDLVGAEHMFRSALKENPYLLKSLSDLGDLLKVTGRADEGKKLHKRWKRVRARLKELEDD